MNPKMSDFCDHDNEPQLNAGKFLLDHVTAKSEGRFSTVRTVKLLVTAVVQSVQPRTLDFAVDGSGFDT
jgi:hypothetical protein